MEQRVTRFLSASPAFLTAQHLCRDDLIESPIQFAESPRG